MSRRIIMLVLASLSLLAGVGLVSASCGPTAPVQATYADLEPTEAGHTLFCDTDEEGLYVHIKNNGEKNAPASTTRVVFRWGGTQNTTVDLPTPSISSRLALLTGGNNTAVVGPFPIPLGCFDPDCGFTITVDVNDDVSESDETNNSADGRCIG
jgi:hypothetical protein